MLVATLATFFYPGMTNYPLIIIAVAIGGAIAWISGRRVAMTNMPQMIALYNGMGGGAAAAIAAVELYRGGEMAHTEATLAVVGAMVALGAAATPLEKTIGFIGVLLAAGNAVGGYAVTERMLEMFKSSGARKPGAAGGKH